MRSLALVTLAVLATTLVGGCGMSRTVPGQPVAAVRIPTISNTPPTSPPVTSTTTTSTSSPVEEPPDPSLTESTTTPANDPAAVVRAYFDAINARDYQRAWDLGGKNVGGQTYETFVAGFASTDHDVVTIKSVRGNTVTADLEAFQTDGTKRTFHGTYTVTNGILTRFSVRATG